MVQIRAPGYLSISNERSRPADNFRLMIFTVLAWQMSRPLPWQSTAKSQLDARLPSIISTSPPRTQFLPNQIMAVLRLGSATDGALLATGDLASGATCSSACPRL
jgi:hypothetical protein